MDNKIIRGNNEIEHWDEKHTQMYGKFGQPYEEWVPTDWDNTQPLSDGGCEIALLKLNHESITRKSLIDIGCAHGAIPWYIKTNVLPDWNITGSDFSQLMIDENKKRCTTVNWEQRDVLLNPLTEDYGVVICNQTIEHFYPGKNWEFLDNVLEHCEYAIIATVDTEDDCFGEHISFYKLETLREMGYDVVWESKLTQVNSPIPGDFYTIMWIIKGKLT